MPNNYVDGLISDAEAIGTEHGKNAAGWVFDGNTPRETYAAVLRGLDAGDPAVLDALPAATLVDDDEDQPNADGYSEGDLASDLVGDDEYVDLISHPRWGEICDAYLMAADTACQQEIERQARYQLADDD